MSKNLKLVSLLLIFVVMISVFVGCGKKSDDTAASEDTNALSTADINFVDADGESLFSVIRPDASEYGTLNGKIFRQIKDKFGVTAKNSTDADPKDDRAEILVGNTNREASAFALEYLKTNGTGRYHEFVVCSVGKDIAIVAYNDEDLEKAVDYFIANYITGSVIEGGINYLYTDTSNYTVLNILGTTKISDIKIVRPIYNVAYMTQLETDKLMDYILEKTGYKVDLVNDNIASDTDDKLSGSGTLTPSTPNEYEIIIGNCVRDGVKSISNYREYEIRVEDKKIFLNGGSPYATAMAVSEFLNLLKTKDSITSADNVLKGDYDEAYKKYDSAEYYYPTFTEDFDNKNIDDLKYWTCRWNATAGYSNAEKPCYRGSTKLYNNYLEDGKCYINAAVDDSGYYGGMLDTDNKLEFLYGVLELSTLHPKGDGFWTALWTVSDNGMKGPLNDPQRMYHSETDVEECYGPGDWAYGNTFAWPTAYGRQVLEIPANKEGTVHVNNRVSCADDRGFYMDFHTFAFVWDSDENVKFTCDGYVYVDQDLREGPEKLVYSQPQWIKLSMACGTGNRPATTDPVAWERYNKYITEYVHIYQKKGNKLYFSKNPNGSNIYSNWTEKTFE